MDELRGVEEDGVDPVTRRADGIGREGRLRDDHPAMMPRRRPRSPIPTAIGKSSERVLTAAETKTPEGTAGP